MKGYIKCDICGKHYKAKRNEGYSGLVPFFYNRCDEVCTCTGGYIVERNGDFSGIPSTIDMCHDCFDGFVNWVKLCRNEAGWKND